MGEKCVFLNFVQQKKGFLTLVFEIILTPKIGKDRIIFFMKDMIIIYRVSHRSWCLFAKKNKTFK
jgi:hypothetical protein